MTTLSQLDKEWYWEDHFLNGGGVSFPASAQAYTPWVITETSSAGTPIFLMNQDYGAVASPPGLAKIGFDSQNEVQNVCLSFGDVLTFSILDQPVFDFRLRMGQSALNSTTSFAFGVTGDRNSTIDSIDIHALFRVIGADSTTLIVCETDDGASDNDDKPTNLTLTTSFRTFRIDMRDLSDVKFSMTDNAGFFPRRVALGTTFNMSGYAGSLQPFFQIQKTANANTDYFEPDFISARGTKNT